MFFVVLGFAWVGYLEYFLLINKDICKSTGGDRRLESSNHTRDMSKTLCLENPKLLV
jgi:hypothetical protein